MSIKNFTLTIFALLILGACSVDQEELEELFVELETSAESVEYGEGFTLTWNSNASQCYASGSFWFGEKPPSGSEDFLIKRGGDGTYILECRRNNEFANQALIVTVNKSVADHFLYLPAEEVNFSIEYAADEEVAITSVARGDFSGDLIPDVLIAVQIRKSSDHTLVDTMFLQSIGGPSPIITEIETSECSGASIMLPIDLNGDGPVDLITATSNLLGQTEQSNLCHFSGSATGLVFDNTFINNETNLDFDNARVITMGLVDRDNDLRPDLYLLTEEYEYWVQADGAPDYEEFSYDGTIISDLIVTSATVIDFDLDQNSDIVLAAYDDNNHGKFITVPRSGDGTNWAEALSYEAPLAKTLISFDYDQDTFLDMLVVGDESPSNDFNASNTSTFKIYEEDETNILDTERDISFTKQGSASLNQYIIITDYDQDGDGGDFLLTFNKFGNNTANFLVGEKQITENDDGTTSYSVTTYDDEELGVDNLPYDNAFTIFFDYNIDFDLDAIFIDDDESTNTLNFYIQENDSN
mgnify:FL=1